jgi:hypothetical protein
MIPPFHPHESLWFRASNQTCSRRIHPRKVIAFLEAELMLYLIANGASSAHKIQRIPLKSRCCKVCNFMRRGNEMPSLHKLSSIISDPLYCGHDCIRNMKRSWSKSFPLRKEAGHCAAPRPSRCWFGESVENLYLVGPPQRRRNIGW